MEAYAKIRKQVMDNLGGAYENFDESQGDPVKAAKAMLHISKVSNPPLSLSLGNDSFDNIGKQLDLQRKELQDWEELTKATAYTSDVAIVKG